MSIEVKKDQNKFNAGLENEDARNNVMTVEQIHLHPGVERKVYWGNKTPDWGGGPSGTGYVYIDGVHVGSIHLPAEARNRGYM